VIDPIPNTPLFNVTGQRAVSVPLYWTPDVSRLASSSPAGLVTKRPYAGSPPNSKLPGHGLDATRPFSARPQSIGPVRNTVMACSVEASTALVPTPMRNPSTTPPIRLTLSVKTAVSPFDQRSPSDD
jgi:hypothetical protein